LSSDSYLEQFLKLNVLGTRILVAPGDLSAARAGHDHPVGIRVRQLELTAVLVLEVEGVQVREERYRDSDTTGQPLCRGNEHDPIQWARDRPKLIVQEKNNKIYSVFKRTTDDSYPFL